MSSDDCFDDFAIIVHFCQYFRFLSLLTGGLHCSQNFGLFAFRNAAKSYGWNRKKYIVISKSHLVIWYDISDWYYYFISFICQFVSISIEENKLCRHAIKRYYSCVILSRYPFKYSSRKAVIKVISLGSSFIHFSLLYRPNFFFLILFYSLLLSMFLLHQDKFTTEHNCTFCSRVNDRPRKHDLLSAETYL